MNQLNFFLYAALTELEEGHECFWKCWKSKAENKWSQSIPVPGCVRWFDHPLEGSNHLESVQVLGARCCSREASRSSCSEWSRRPLWFLSGVDPGSADVSH